MTRRKPTSVCLLLVLVVAWCSAIAFFATTALADSFEDDYVRQVVEEGQQQYSDSYYTEEDKPPQKQQQQQQQHNKNDGHNDDGHMDPKERAAREAADRKASDRERQFQAELDRIDDEEQRKTALKQKKIDGRRVKSVLKAAEKSDLYTVLGIRNWKVRIPPILIDIAMVKFTIPGLTLWKGPTEQQIKKQFRQRALQVHPDKNRDGRAEEAFVAVQNAASILSDKNQRQQYDAERTAFRSDQLESSKRLVATSLAAAWAVLRKMIKVVQTLLGPFFLPVVIIGTLII